jgi:hypothetical protein
MVWNILAASFLLWLSRRYQRQLKPGALFAGWLIAAGVGRVIIEFFRPDQPKIPGFGFSYSSLVSALMAIAGVIMLLVRYKKINPAFAENWEEEYQIAKPIAEVEGSVGSETPQVKRTENRGESTLKKKAKAKIAERKAKEASSTRTTRAKKSS